MQIEAQHGLLTREALLLPQGQRSLHEQNRQSIRLERRPAAELLRLQTEVSHNRRMENIAWAVLALGAAVLVVLSLWL